MISFLFRFRTLLPLSREELESRAAYFTLLAVYACKLAVYYRVTEEPDKALYLLVILSFLKAVMNFFETLF